MPICRKCNEPKDENDFHFKNKKLGKRNIRCKSCACEVAEQNYYANRQRAVTNAILGKKRRKVELQQWIDSIKDAPCKDCGDKFPPYCMDFDHREGETKVYCISELTAYRLWAKQRILEEIAKCDLVCSNCHRIRTHRRRKPKGF